MLPILAAAVLGCAVPLTLNKLDVANYLSLVSYCMLGVQKILSNSMSSLSSRMRVLKEYIFLGDWMGLPLSGGWVDGWLSMTYW